MTARQYAAAGVDLRRLEEAKARIARAVSSTRTELSAGEIGAFGGMLALPPGLSDPLLVLSTDSVGTKVLVARAAGVYDTVGEDLVNHSVNDILVHGATPIGFQDYIGGNAIDEEQLASLVEGVARGCRAHRMALTGGETAALPDLYDPGDFDLAGTIVGVVERHRALHGDRIRAGDVIIGYESSGLHTNGYSLARAIVFDRLGLRLDSSFPETDRTVAEVLLAVHRSYVAAVAPVLDRVHGIAHITGGGIPGNLVRVLPRDTEAVIDAGSWAWPTVFEVLRKAGSVSLEEMREVFNCGAGLLVIAAPADVDVVRRAAAAASVPTWIAGEVWSGSRGVRFR